MQVRLPGWRSGRRETSHQYGPRWNTPSWYAKVRPSGCASRPDTRQNYRIPHRVCGYKVNFQPLIMQRSVLGGLVLVTVGADLFEHRRPTLGKQNTTQGLRLQGQFKLQQRSVLGGLVLVTVGADLCVCLGRNHLNWNATSHYTERSLGFLSTAHGELFEPLQSRESPELLTPAPAYS